MKILSVIWVLQRSIIKTHITVTDKIVKIYFPFLVKSFYMFFILISKENYGRHELFFEYLSDDIISA